jgi:CRP-like cAMP-binding protein
MPAHALFVTEDNSDRRERKGQEQLERRRSVLGSLELFSHLNDQERDELVLRLRPASFARGEVVHRQGSEAHWLYVLFEGKVEERVSKAGIEEGAFTLEAPNIFGEISLMTGTPRAATVVALSDLECYRIDKEAFDRIMHRPEVAERMAQVLAKRTLELERARGELDAEATKRTLAAAEKDVLSKIREFFSVAKPN